jgi:hypothetical protein
MSWADIPTIVSATGNPTPCVLFHPHTTETEAFDAGYASLLKSRDSRLFARAVRSIAAGASLSQSAADSAGPQAPGQTGLRLFVAEDNQISQQIIAIMLRAGDHHSDFGPRAGDDDASRTPQSACDASIGPNRPVARHET